MVSYAVPMLAGLVLHIPENRVVPVGVVVGLVNGVLSGLTGSYTVPGVMYLQALGLTRDELIQAMGLLFLLSTTALGISLGGFGLMGGQEAVASATLVVPACPASGLDSVRARKCRRPVSAGSCWQPSSPLAFTSFHWVSGACSSFSGRSRGGKSWRFGPRSRTFVSNVIPAKRSASRDRGNVVFAVFFGLFRQISAHRSRIFAALHPG